MDVESIPTGIPQDSGPIDAVVIGASLGGPPAIKKVLAGLPADLPAPVAVCQHIAPSMVGVLAEQLDRVTPLSVRLARHREPFEPGHVYVAPGGRHMRVLKTEGIARIRLDEDFADSLHVPSIDVLFSSVAMAFGSCALAVLLTGMGSDGALGMHAIRRAGGYTLCESEETAVSYSMPGSAVELGAAAAQFPIESIAGALMVRVRNGGRA